ncbi:hypothetical protein BU23DRAFT_552505 [Bimuria novae-zelandiae CBS 107.79]|uniref:Myb-like domain-containing protein n=1 Tax=Bimuria novae-zelandiae CBS 107.79 TaxID=1447943 RepID=A0A6A5VER6_9PLEO|nr:hypothetical protein BU23DRAFT_552505 [Bimuria novae-zelandiae CBS 107.79]
MEPRIATLLGNSPLERPPTDHIRAHSTSSLPGQSQQYTNSAPQRQNPSAPIANVLNTVTPFSGRLSDLLLDGVRDRGSGRSASQQQALQKNNEDEAVGPPPPAGPENSLLTLPKPNQQRKKSSNSWRIPPLLQGLHQVPPQAQSRRFPPITSESGAFGRDIGDGVGLRSAVALDQRTAQDNDTAPRAPLVSRSSISTEARDDSGEKPTSASATGDGESRSHADRANALPRKRKRQIWSDQETKDLLVGVAKYGIGNWKKILQCPDFSFHQRSAVDLKDRFRTCCPGKGLKSRKSRRKGAVQEVTDENTAASSTTTSVSSNHDSINPDSVAVEALYPINVLRRNRESTNHEVPLELRAMGMHGTFARRLRRERRPFTEQDDENLLKGFEKYSSSWHSMRDDKELGFSTRHPTDLRDRFRIRYPDKFSKAGYKLKPKHELILKEKEKDQDKDAGNSQTSATSEDNSNSSRAKEPTTDTSFSSLTSTGSSNSSLIPSALRESFLSSFAGPLDDFGEPGSEDDGESSPIILNRNIFEWADANPSQMPAVSGTNLTSMGIFISDAHFGNTSASDSIPVDPALMPNPHMALLNSNVHLSISQPPQQASSRLPEPYQYPSNPPPVQVPSSSATTSTLVAPSKHSTDPLLRTPNLPTIVFPHVPASSARSAVHNLPPPADLLSGVEQDMRPEVQTGPFTFDDSLGFMLPSGTGGVGYTSSATLAPMNGIAGREMPTLERGLLQEPGRGG